ncbi:hypothetical protein FKM82_018485 [Ascaphus truei]
MSRTRCVCFTLSSGWRSWTASPGRPCSPRRSSRRKLWSFLSRSVQKGLGTQGPMYFPLQPKEYSKCHLGCAINQSDCLVSKSSVASMCPQVSLATFGAGVLRWTQAVVMDSQSSSLECPVNPGLLGALDRHLHFKYTFCCLVLFKQRP